MQFKVGNTVYFIYHDDIITGTVTDIQTNNERTVLTVKGDAPWYGTWNTFAENAFTDNCTARSELYAREHNRLKAYKAEIKDLTDLMRFAMRHNIADGDRDEAARLAFVSRAEELGYKLKED